LRCFWRMSFSMGTGLLATGFTISTQAGGYQSLSIVRPAISCEQLAHSDLSMISDAKIVVNSALVRETDKGPYCRVTATAEPNISFAADLPIERWTQRFVLGAHHDLSGLVRARHALVRLQNVADDDLLSDVRVGLACGPVLLRNGDYFGPTVNLAHRIVNIANPGTVLMSDEFHAALTEEAKLPGLLLHDFRRSAVRNMIPRGVPQKIAREISGHKTDSVFNRYNIVSEADLRDAARRIEAGAKTVVMHSECTVEPGRQPDQERQKEQKPIQSVS